MLHTQLRHINSQEGAKDLIEKNPQVAAILDEVFPPEGQMQTTFKAGEIETGYHPSGFRIDKTGAPLDRYTQWEIDANGRWHSAKPVCFHTLPEQGWMKDDPAAGKR